MIRSFEGYSKKSAAAAEASAHLRLNRFAISHTGLYAVRVWPCAVSSCYGDREDHFFVLTILFSTERPQKEVSLWL